MIYARSLLAGILGGLAAAVLWMVVAFILPIAIPVVIGRLTNTGGAAVASIGSGSILAAALIGFLIGVVWYLRAQARAT